MPKQEIIIAKFGGTSVSTAKRIVRICELVAKEQKANKYPVVVASALSGVTDLLLSLTQLSPTEIKKVLLQIENMHRKLIRKIFKNKPSRKETLEFVSQKIDELTKLIVQKKITKKLTDRILSYGEILSTYIIVQALNQSGSLAKQIIASDVIVTDQNHGDAEFIPDETRKKVTKLLFPLLNQGFVPVVTGFIGATKGGYLTTLGRGGSDYTASILGYSLGAAEIDIWTDVDGIYTADPRIVKDAQILSEVSYKEASEMAFFGAKVLHPRALRPAISAKIPLRVLNTLRPQAKGTVIQEKADTAFAISAITSKKKITLVTMYSTEMLYKKGFLAALFAVFAKHKISIDLVSASEVSVSVTLDNDENLGRASKELSKFTRVTILKEQSIVSLIGDGIANSPKTIKNLFDVLDKKGIRVKMVSLSASNINISIVVDSKLDDEVVKLLHTGLLLKWRKK